MTVHALFHPYPIKKQPIYYKVTGEQEALLHVNEKYQEKKNSNSEIMTMQKYMYGKRDWEKQESKMSRLFLG